MRPPIHDPNGTLDARPGASLPAAVGFPPAEAVSPGTLAVAARASMEAEWDRGNSVPAEWYFEQAPSLRDDPTAALDLIFLEYVLRDEAGEEPTAEEFAARFPAFSPRIRQLLDLDSALTHPGELETTSFRLRPDTTDTLPPKTGLETPSGNRTASIGRYLVVESLGSGGQADVFLGIHPTLGRQVVIKRLKAGGLDTADAVERLAAEGRVLAVLDHPNLARVYDLEIVDGRAVLVMELIRGRNLADVRRHTPVSPADAARWTAAVARAADHAHVRGVLHLDIKPRNVMLDESGRAVLIDFGLALVDRGLESPETEKGVSGTLTYMAPEQARGESNRLGPPTDVYGLGGVLYYLLVGKDPICAATPPEAYARARSGDWDRDALRGVRAPAAVVKVCERALEPDPAKRFPSAAALADALEAAVRPRRWPWAMAAVAVLLAAIGLALTWGRSDKAADVPPSVSGPQPILVAKPDLRFEFEVYREKDFTKELPTHFFVGEKARVKAMIPPGWHATLFLATESGKVEELTREVPEPIEHLFLYRPSPEPENAALMELTEPTGTHVFLLAASLSGPVGAEQLGLRKGEEWAHLPAGSVIRVARGRAEIWASSYRKLLAGGRDIKPGGVVADPERAVEARLTRLLRDAPSEAIIEGVAFAVKNR